MNAALRRIDAHQHFWKYNPIEFQWIDDSMDVLKQDYLPEDLGSILKHHKIKGSIAVQARSCIQETDFLLNLAEYNPNILGVIGWINLRSDTLSKDLERWAAQPKLKGYRHLVQDEPNPSAFLEDEAFNQGVETLLRSGKVYEVLVHEKDLPAAIQFCQRHDQGKLVLCHMGKPDVQHTSAIEWGKQIAPLATLPHVSCKLSGIITEAKWCQWTEKQLMPFIEMAFEVFGPSRLMFGSDWPVCLCSGQIDQVYHLVEKMTSKLSVTDQQAIWGLNAARIYEV